MDDPNLYAKCALRHYGPWMIDTVWLVQAVDALKAGHMAVKGSSDSQGIPYQVDDGIAIVPIWGQMMKGPSKYGGTDSLEVRKLIRRASTDPNVNGILLHVDSPGGTVAGTADLADEVNRVSKPVVTFVDDLAASAAYWVTSQSDSIIASRIAEVGSIGTFAVIKDTSGAAAADGIKVHVIATGAYKAIGVPGAEVTDEHLEYLRTKVEESNGFFLDAVVSGRGFPRDIVQSWATGKTFRARVAADMGMIDAVGDFSAAVGVLRGMIQQEAAMSNSGMRKKILQARISTA